MVKKKLKHSIVIIGILILVATVCYLCIGKNTILTNAIQKSKALFSPNEEDGSITYNTAGDDSANYIDGDTSGEKSRWIKNGDTWTYTFYVDDPNAEWYVYEDSSTLMEGYTGDHTEYNADKLFTEEILTEFTPSADMTVTQNTNGNNVYTWLDSENSYKVIDNGDGTYKKVTTKLSLTVTNYKVSENETNKTETIHYGDLTINKIVKNSQGTVLSANEDTTNFIFTITLTADDNHKGLVEGTKVYGDVVFKNGVGTVSLKAGGNITISGIPEDLSYSVVERTVDGYDKTCETSYYGKIDEDTPGVVTYVNTQKPRQSPSGQGGSGVESFVNVTIKKVVTGNSEVEENYDFEIALDNLKPDATYTLSNGSTFTADSVGSANVTVSLGNNQTVIIENIPVGSKYKVFEHAGDFISSYLITDSNNIGSINNSANSNTKVNTALATNTETADEGENVTITFTNKKVITQNLKIEKTVTDDEDTNSYLFEIQFANMEEGTSFNSTVGKVTADSNGKADLTIYLAGGENAEFYEVPVGTTYTIKELASSSIASYTITDANNGNNIASASGANTISKKALSTEIETVNQGEEATVTFTNDTVNQEPDSVSTSIGLTKSVVKPDGSVIEDCNEEFTFEITAGDVSYPAPEKATVTVKGNGEASFGTITFDKTGTYTYKIVEKAGNSDIYKYDEAEYVITYEVTNPEGLLEISKSVKKNGFEAGTISFTNILSKFDVIIFKSDESNKPVNGAKLQILDNENNVVKEWITGKDIINPLIIKLAEGTYTLHEVEAPNGYEEAKDVVFVVDGNGKVSVNGEEVTEVVMKDPKVKEEEPVDPGKPDEPTTPDEPITPNEPSEPDEPTNPDKPEQPEEPENKDEEKPTPTPDKPNSPQTGDNIVIAVVIGILAIMVFVVTKKKSKKV